jgi:hypothetical protein
LGGKGGEGFMLLGVGLDEYALVMGAVYIGPFGQEIGQLFCHYSWLRLLLYFLALLFFILFFMHFILGNLHDIVILLISSFDSHFPTLFSLHMAPADGAFGLELGPLALSTQITVYVHFLLTCSD